MYVIWIDHICLLIPKYIRYTFLRLFQLVVDLTKIITKEYIIFKMTSVYSPTSMFTIKHLLLENGLTKGL